ncbi:MAG: hypothetical protein WEA29_02660 [Acidimicrobiia bacterium]
MDIAVNLVESYLRLNGYLTLTEVEVQHPGASGLYESITDIDVVAIRFPGDMFAADLHGEADSRMLLIEDDGLYLGPEMVDVIIGEVKEGPARLNAAVRRHEVLHMVLRRLDWIYESGVDPVLADLQRRGLSEAMGRSGAVIRTRLVAFGADPGEPTLHLVPLSHVLERMVEFMERFDDVLRPTQFKEPAPALLRLLVKCGFRLTNR